MRLLLLADTHVPRRARDLPAQVWAEVERADLVVHAGDWVDVSLLDLLEQRSASLLACWGNNDGPPLRARLPEVAYATCGGVRVAVVHETGQATGREARAQARHPDVDLLVFGHSHIPWDTTAPSGLRLLNPGSPTDRRRQPACTYLTAELSDGQVRDVLLHAIDVHPAARHPAAVPSAAVQSAAVPPAAVHPAAVPFAAVTSAARTITTARPAGTRP